MSGSPLIAADALASRMGSPDWVVVDCRFSLANPAAGRAAYVQGHIPGARYADLDRDLARPPAPHEGRHPLPERTALAARLGQLGIANDSTVVAYDDADSAVAARLWWLLRWLGHEQVHVLDGGFAAWRALDLPVEARGGAAAARIYRPVAREAAGPVTTDELASGIVPFGGSAAGVLVDVRAPARFRGEHEPIDPVAGHVPGALNRPFAQNVLPDGRFRPSAELRRELQSLLGARAPRDLIAMCGSGVTACHLLLAMAAAGLDGGRLYAGSWSEWVRDRARPVATAA